VKIISFYLERFRRYGHKNVPVLAHPVQRTLMLVRFVGYIHFDAMREPDNEQDCRSMYGALR